MNWDAISKEELVQKLAAANEEIAVLKEQLVDQRSIRERIDLELQERRKELECHNQISIILNERGQSLDDTLQKILNIIPPAFLRPECTSACILVRGKRYATPHFSTNNPAIQDEIRVGEDAMGEVIVSVVPDASLPNLPLFLDEERVLLRSIVTRIALFVDRVEKEKWLKDNEALYHSIIDASPDVITITSMEGIILFNSPKAANMFGGESEKQFEGRSLLEFIHPSCHPQAISGIEKMHAGIFPGAEDYIGLKQDGTLFDIAVNGSFIYDAEGKPVKMVFSTRDVTARKQIEKELLESKEHALMIMNSLDAFIYISDFETHELLFVNDYGKAEWGEDLAFAKCYKVLQGAEEPCSFCTNSKLVDEHGNPTGIYHWEFQNQVNKRWYDIRDRAIPWTNGRLVRMEIATDITALKTANEELRKLSRAIEQSPVSIVITDLEGKIEYANPNASVTTGYSVDELMGQNPRVLKSGDTEMEVYQELWKGILEGQVWRGIFHNKRKNGELYWEAATIAPIQDSNGKISHFVAIKEDITQRKQAEDEIKLFRSISDQANYGTAILDLSGNLIYVNQSMAQMHGYEPVELLNKHFTIVHNQEQANFVLEKLDAIRIEGGFTAKEIWHCRKDGTIFPTLMSAKLVYGEDARPKYLSATMIDITDHKASEISLKESEERLNFAQELGATGSWTMYFKEQKATMSANTYRLLGYQPFDESLTYQVFLEHIHPDDLHLVQETIDESIQSKVSHTFPMRVYTEAGELKWFSNLIYPIIQNDETVGLTGVVADITEKRQYEQKIKEQNEKLNALISTMPDLIFIISRDGVYEEVYLNSFEGILAPPEHIIGKKITDIFDQELTKYHLEEIHACIATNKVRTYHYFTDLPHGKQYWEARIAPLGQDRIVAIVRDFTDKKAKDDEIKKLSLAVEQSPVLIEITDLDANIEYVNPAFIETTGYSLEELIGQNPRLLKSGTTPPSVYEDLWDTITKGQKWQGEWINKKKNGELYWESVSVSPIFNEAGKITNYVAVKQDITQKKKWQDEILELNTNLEGKIALATIELQNTNSSLLIEIDERKQIESALQVKTMELENFFGVAIDLLAIANLEGQFVKVNRAWFDVLGYPVEQLVGSYFFDYIHPDDLEVTQNAIDALTEENPILNIVNRYRTADGMYRFLEWRSRTIGNRIYAAARDITERKRAEEFEMEMLRLTSNLTGITYPEIDGALDLLLARIGRFLSADRSYIFEFDASRILMNNTFEWCNEGIEPQIENLQEIPIELFPNWMTLLTTNETIFIPRVSDLSGDMESLKEALEPQGIQSLLVIPLIIENILIGFVGLDSVVNEREYTKAEINTLKVWSSVISSLIHKKRNEHLLELTRQNYETFFNTIDDFLWVLDTQGEIIHTNTTVTRRLGFNPDELLHKSILMVHPQERRDEAAQIVKEMLVGNEEFCPVPVITKEGQIIPVVTKIKHGFWNDQPVVFGVSKDVSQLQLSEQKFSSAFQSNSTMMAISLFEEGVYVDVNSELLETFGFQREEVIGKTYSEVGIFVEPETRGEITESIRAGFPVRKWEVLLRTKEGTIRTGLMSADSIYIGEQRCLLTVTMDITDRKRMEEDLVKARYEAEQANMAKSEFLSRMSHELRTPMNSILGFAQLLDLGSLTLTQRKNLNHILKSGKHLLDLINEVLDITRIEAGRLSLSLEPVQVSGIISEIVDSYLPQAQEHNVRIFFVPSPDSGLFINADRQRLKQILLNLLSNAVKYNRVNGTVTIKAERREPTEEGLTPYRISVIDTGFGIAPENLKKLFVPFERIGAEKTNTQGSGLGLSVVKKLISAMGGIVEVESQLDQGTTFWIELSTCDGPLDNLHKSSLQSTQTNDLREIKGSLLYIEDNASNIELIEEIIALQRSNIRMHSTPSGLAACALAKEYKPDIILLDLNLPDIHGSEVIKMLIDDSETNRIPVVIISADATQDQLRKLLAAGAKHYLTKPIDVDGFLEIVDFYLKDKL